MSILCGNAGNRSAAGFSSAWVLFSVIMTVGVFLSIPSIGWCEEPLYTRPAETEDIGGGFLNHGRPVRLGWFRGMACTENAQGEGLVLVWLGRQSLLEINVETGEYREHFNPGAQPFTSIIAGDGRFYTHQSHHFIVFDPELGELGFAGGRTEGRRAFGRMAEDEEGRIWAAMLGSCDLAMYDPSTGEVHEYTGIVEGEGLRLRPRHLTADTAGWIYFWENVSTPMQWIMFNPGTGEAASIFPEEKRREVIRGSIERSTEGEVYLRLVFKDEDRKDAWYELYAGEAKPLEAKPDYKYEYISANWNLRHRDLPGDERVKELDLDRRRLLIQDTAAGTTREVRFEYEATQNAVIKGVESTLDGRILCPTMKPWRFAYYNPSTDEFTANTEFLTQWNAMTRTKDGMVYAGLHPEATIHEYNPERKLTDEGRTAEHNPRFAIRERYPGRPYVSRVTDILAYPPEERYIILAGHSDEGHMAGGGLLFFDRETESYEVMTHEELIPLHDNYSIGALPGGRILVGTTSRQYSVHSEPLESANLYILNVDEKDIEWQGIPVEDASIYRDMVVDEAGEKAFLLVTEWREANPRLFVFDIGRRKVVKEINVSEKFGDSAWGQAPRTFIRAPGGRIFMLFRRAIAELNPETYELIKRASTPEGIDIKAGGTYCDGRLYFSANRVYLCSWEVSAD